MGGLEDAALGSGLGGSGRRRGGHFYVVEGGGEEEGGNGLGSRLSLDDCNVCLAWVGGLRDM